MAPSIPGPGSERPDTAGDRNIHELGWSEKIKELNGRPEFSEGVLKWE
jgi:hypothetical protein